MNKFNVLDITDNLEHLNQDMLDWSRLPFEMRMRANDECIRVYGITNQELYYRMRNAIINKVDVRTIDSDNITIKESTELEVIERARTIQKLNPYIRLIDPCTTSMDELKDQYDSYIKLAHKFKLISNDLSFKLFGLNVPNMYLKVQSEIEDNEIKENDRAVQLAIDSISFMEEDAYNSNLISLYLRKFDLLNEETFTDNHDAIVVLKNRIDEAIDSLSYDINDLAFKSTPTIVNLISESTIEPFLDEKIDIDNKNELYIVFLKGNDNKVYDTAFSFDASLNCTYKLVDGVYRIHKLRPEDLIDVYIVYIPFTIQYSTIKRRVQYTSDKTINPPSLNEDIEYLLSLKDNDKSGLNIPRDERRIDIAIFLKNISRFLNNDEIINITNVYKVFEGSYELYDSNRILQIRDLICNIKLNKSQYLPNMIFRYNLPDMTLMDNDYSRMLKTESFDRHKRAFIIKEARKVIDELLSLFS